MILPHSRFETRPGSKVLVTGAAGFIGSHTVEALISDGHSVLGVDDLSTGSLQNLTNVIKNDRFEFVQADVLDSESLDSICRQFVPHAIIHLAGLVSVVVAQEDPIRNFELNIEATQIVAETARKNNVNRLVFASSAAVYGDCNERLIHENCPTRPVGMYGSAKLASENILLGYAISYEMEVVCLRYFNVYGDRQDPKNPYSGVISIFSDRFARGEAVNVYGDGSQTRDFVSVRDIARANVLAATNRKVESGSRNVSTGNSRSINELISIFQRIYPDSPLPIHQPGRTGEIIHSCGNGGYSALMLGFEPYISMEDGLADLVAVKNLSPYENLVLPG